CSSLCCLHHRCMSRQCHPSPIHHDFLIFCLILLFIVILIVLIVSLATPNSEQHGAFESTDGYGSGMFAARRCDVLGIVGAGIAPQGVGGWRCRIACGNSSGIDIIIGFGTAISSRDTHMHEMCATSSASPQAMLQGHVCSLLPSGLDRCLRPAPSLGHSAHFI